LLVPVKIMVCILGKVVFLKKIGLNIPRSGPGTWPCTPTGPYTQKHFGAC